MSASARTFAHPSVLAGAQNPALHNSQARVPRNMSSDKPVTMKYLADVAGVSPGLVRRYAALFRSLVSDPDVPTSPVGVSATRDHMLDGAVNTSVVKGREGPDTLRNNWERGMNELRSPVIFLYEAVTAFDKSLRVFDLVFK